MTPIRQSKSNNEQLTTNNDSLVTHFLIDGPCAFTDAKITYYYALPAVIDVLCMLIDGFCTKNDALNNLIDGLCAFTDTKITYHYAPRTLVDGFCTKNDALNNLIDALCTFTDTKNTYHYASCALVDGFCTKNDAGNSLTAGRCTFINKNSHDDTLTHYAEF